MFGSDMRPTGRPVLRYASSEGGRVEGYQSSSSPKDDIDDEGEVPQRYNERSAGSLLIDVARNLSESVDRLLEDSHRADCDPSSLFSTRSTSRSRFLKRGRRVVGASYRDLRYDGGGRGIGSRCVHTTEKVIGLYRKFHPLAVVLRDAFSPVKVLRGHC